MLELIELGVLEVTFSLAAEARPLNELLRRYRSVPMSLADACLVRLSEIHERCFVMTIDGDFRIYRRYGRRAIPVLMPAER